MILIKICSLWVSVYGMKCEWQEKLDRTIKQTTSIQGMKNFSWVYYQKPKVHRIKTTQSTSPVTIKPQETVIKL